MAPSSGTKLGLLLRASPNVLDLSISRPTVHLPILRVILAFTATHDLHLWSVNVSDTYLNGEMNCDIYMEQPEGFAEGNPMEIVCLLQKALYGMKQGGNR